MPHFKSLPEHGTAFDIFAAWPEMYEPIAKFSDLAFRGDGPLSQKDRETIFSYVSGQNACQYCFGGHSTSAVKLGLPPDALEKLNVDIDSAPVDDALKPLLRYAHKLNHTPNQITQADADACFDAGWDEAALNITIALTCLANFMNRLVEGFGIEADPTKFDMRAEMATTDGYWTPFERKMAAAKEAAE